MGWWLAFGCAAACLCCGLVAFVVQAFAGDPGGSWGWGLAVTGMRTAGIGGAPWGLYIIGDVFFIGVSFAGTAIGVLTHLFKIPAIRPLGRIAELISILSLAMAGMFVLADQGRPLVALLNLPLFTKPESPFFGTFVLLCSYLFTNLVFFFLDSRADAAEIASRKGPFAWVYGLVAAGWTGTPGEQKRHERVCFWLAVITLLMLIVEQSTAGLIFGTQLGRPGWFSDLLAPSFLVLAAVSGVGVLLVVVAVLRHFLGLGQQIQMDTFRWLLRALLVLTAIASYLIATEAFKSWYSAPTRDTALAHEIVFGEFAPYFWTMVASFAVVFVVSLWQLVAPQVSIGWVVVAGVLANVGVLLKRLLVVVPSQTRGMLLAAQDGAYTPTWVEYVLALGVFAFSVCVYLLFVRVFPVVHEAHAAPSVAPAEPSSSRARRLLLTWGTALAGLALAVVSLASSARLGVEPYLDPPIPASPMLFILGLALMLLSVVVYDAYHPAQADDPTPSAGDRMAWSADGSRDSGPGGKQSPIDAMLRAMREVDGGVPVAVVSKQLGMAEKAFHRYREKFADLEGSEAQRLRDLEEEILRLKKLLSAQSLHNEELREVVSKKRW